MGWRRLVLLVLLLTVPFQAAWGGTGLLCVSGTHHWQPAVAAPPAATPHQHDAAASHAHHHSTAMVAVADGGDHGVSTAGADKAPVPSGQCKTCSECCSASAPLPAASFTAMPPPARLLVAATVTPALVARAGDGLFRPPRTTHV